MRQVLVDLVSDLRSCGLTACQTIDGRIGSTSDESKIIEWLTNHPKWKNYVKQTKIRGAGDIIVIDYDINHPPHLVNIKTTLLNTDNATSFVGFTYSLTDLSLDELPKKIKLKKLIALCKARPNPVKTKDYYYLVFDKGNMSNVQIRPLKDIEHWSTNPTNWLQIKWNKEFGNNDVTEQYVDSHKRIIGGLKNCWKKKVLSMPQDDEWGV